MHTEFTKAEPVLCHRSALLFHRTPPIVHELVGRYPDLLTRADKAACLNEDNPLALFGDPLHLLVQTKAMTHASAHCSFHYRRSGYPQGAVIITDYNIHVTSPLATLMDLAITWPIPHLTMILYEMMGSFAIFRPTSPIRKLLQGLIDRGMLPVLHGWKPALSKGKLTDVWRRPPLLDSFQVERFLAGAESAKGSRKLQLALRDAHEGSASPFEAQSSMLLGMPKRRGGWNLGPFEHNKKIGLTQQARIIAGKATCYGDLYIEGAETHPAILFECQGGAFHDSGAIASADDSRAVALQSMGIVLIRLRYEQISDPMRLECIVSFISKLMGRPFTRKSERLKRAEIRLRALVLVDWWNLGL